MKTLELRMSVKITDETAEKFMEAFEQLKKHTLSEKRLTEYVSTVYYLVKKWNREDEPLEQKMWVKEEGN